MQRAAGEAAAGVSPSARQHADLLPPPMQPGIQEDDRDACIIKDSFKAAMVATRGFEYVPEAPNATSRAAQKWGWVGRGVGERAAGRRWAGGDCRAGRGTRCRRVEQRHSCMLTPAWQRTHASVALHPRCTPVPAGDWLELSVDTSSRSASGNATVHLSFLRGWMWHYGDAVATCMAGCTCDDVPFSTLSEYRFTLYVTLPVQVCVGGHQGSAFLVACCRTARGQLHGWRRCGRTPGALSVRQ